MRSNLLLTPRHGSPLLLGTPVGLEPGETKHRERPPRARSASEGLGGCVAEGSLRVPERTGATLDSVLVLRGIAARVMIFGGVGSGR